MLLHLFPIPNPQSGCRRQCLGVVAKTVEALGVVMTLGFSNLYFIVLEIKFFFILKKNRVPDMGEK